MNLNKEIQSRLTPLIEDLVRRATEDALSKALQDIVSSCLPAKNPKKDGRGRPVGSKNRKKRTGVTYGCVCKVCGDPFKGTSPSATICSQDCRKEYFRMKGKKHAA